MRSPVLIYYLVLFAFAGTLAYSFLSLGDRLQKQYDLTAKAVRQEQEIASRGKMVK